MQDTRALAEIHVGSRHRKDLGLLDTLSESLKTIGLLHPIVISPEGNLIAGIRRLEAARLLGWKTIPVHVIDVGDILQAEHDENQLRKDFTATEMVAIGRALKEKIAAENAARQTEARRRGGQSGGRGRPKVIDETRNSLVPNGHRAIPSELEAQKTANQIATYFGVGKNTYQKAEAVVEAAETEPELYGDLVEQMDATNNVDRAYKAMRKLKAPHEEPVDAMERTRRDPGVRWYQGLYKLNVFIRGVTQYAPGGDISVLTKTWKPALRKQYREQLEAMVVSLQGWIACMRDEE